MNAITADSWASSGAIQPVATLASRIAFVMYSRRRSRSSGQAPTRVW